MTQTLGHRRCGIHREYGLDAPCRADKAAEALATGTARGRGAGVLGDGVRGMPARAHAGADVAVGDRVADAEEHAQPSVARKR